MSIICRNNENDIRLSEQTFPMPNFSEFSREKTISKPHCVQEYPEDFPPEYLSDSELEEDTPRGNELWKKIKNEHQDKIKNLYKQLNDKRTTDIDSEKTQYLTNNIFPVMVQGVVECLKKGDSHNIIRNRCKSRFDPVDFFAGYMYENNPLFKERIKEKNDIYEVFKDILVKNPRPLIPQSWNWSKDEAAVVIQKNVRGWLVRKTPAIQDMRKFWSVLEKPYGAGYWKKEMELSTGIDKQTEIYPDLTYPMYKREGISYDTCIKSRIEEIRQLKKEKANQERFEQELSKAKERFEQELRKTIQTEKRM